MSLTTALSIAQSALRNTSRQTSIVSRNVSDASNPDYTRRIAVVTSTAPGARSIDIQRAASELLFKNNLGALASLEGQRTLYDGMERLGLAVNGADNASSAATAIGALQQALQIYSASPSNRNLAENAVDAARQVVRTLNDGTQAIQSFRADMDSEIGSAVSELNDLLGQLQGRQHRYRRPARATAATSPTRSTSATRCSSRYRASSASRPITRSDNDMVIMTKDGATLFETIPRTVSFQPQSDLRGRHGRQLRLYRRHPAAGRDAAATPILPASSPAWCSCATASPAPCRASSTRSRAGWSPPLPRPTAPAVRCRRWPASSPGPALLPFRRPAPSSTAWLAPIALNAAFDSSAGGNPNLLRDGGANGAGYVHNSGGGASYADLLISYSEKLDQPIAFDAAAAIGTTQSVSSFSTNAISWFEGVRKDASSAAEGKEALATRTEEALSNATGVNVDMEMSLLLDLEHTYEASARLIKAVDDMLSSLLMAVR